MEIQIERKSSPEDILERLYDLHLDKGQTQAIQDLRSGFILRGGVGSGKSRTSLAYILTSEYNGRDIYIITTAKKRDTHEWDQEAAILGWQVDGPCWDNMTLTIDSWNNTKKYKDVKNAFFIFDEQKTSGGGAWAKTFLKIAKSNGWLLLSATPGDRWMDFWPIFVANGFYKNKTEFLDQHVMFRPFTTFPQISGYKHVKKLEFLLRSISVGIDVEKHVTWHEEDVYCDYNRALYQQIVKTRCDPKTLEPYDSMTGMVWGLRRLVNGSQGRLEALERVCRDHERVIVFYTTNFELEMLGHWLNKNDILWHQYNGQVHEPIPNTRRRWVYLVNYMSGAEGWECASADTVVLFSTNYSWRTLEQCKGRIDRRNTPWDILYAYHFVSIAPIDKAIRTANHNKEMFNEQAWASKLVE